MRIVIQIDPNQQVAKPRRRIARKWGALGLLLVFVLIPLVPYTVAAVKDAVSAQSPDSMGNKVQGIANPNPGAQLWRDIRQRDKVVVGETRASGVEAGILISQAGEDWRAFRMRQFVPYSSVLYGVVIVLFILYYLSRGTIRIEGQRSGNTVQRTTKNERYIHWFTAVIFTLLALSGLIILYGRWVLIPVLGAEGFSYIAAASKTLHNYLGPLLLIGLVFMFFAFVRDSLFNFKVDGPWLLSAGGYLGGAHPSSEKYNAGQKAWFWVAVIGGLVLVGSGLVLDFANYGQGRGTMQDAHIIHSISSVIVIAFFLIHVYLATVGVEGSLEAMVSGTVDSNFVKQHHDLWYQQIQGQSTDAGKSGSSS